MDSSIPRPLTTADTLDRVVTELREIDRRSGIDRTLAVGSLILDRFFGGSAEAWRDRRRNKGNSIRRLAERDDCPFRRSALNEAVGVYVAVRELPSVRTFGHITASHVAAVLTLPTADRAHLLERAEAEQMSVRALRAQVVALRRAAGERRGRPRSNEFEHGIATLDRLGRRIGDTIAMLERDSGGVPEVSQTLARLAEQLAGLASRLRTLGASARAPRGTTTALAS